MEFFWNSRHFPGIPEFFRNSKNFFRNSGSFSGIQKTFFRNPNVFPEFQQFFSGIPGVFQKLRNFFGRSRWSFWDSILLRTVSYTLTLVAYFNEFKFSARSAAAGLKHVSITVLAFPPRESLRILVILLVLYGMWVACNWRQIIRMSAWWSFGYNGSFCDNPGQVRTIHPLSWVDFCSLRSGAGG